jgi:hypothetical protein
MAAARISGVLMIILFCQLSFGVGRHFVLDFGASPARPPNQQAQCAENYQDAACGYQPGPDL